MILRGIQLQDFVDQGFYQLETLQSYKGQHTRNIHYPSSNKMQIAPEPTGRVHRCNKQTNWDSCLYHFMKISTLNACTQLSCVSSEERPLDDYNLTWNFTYFFFSFAQNDLSPVFPHLTIFFNVLCFLRKKKRNENYTEQLYSFHNVYQCCWETPVRGCSSEA